MKTTILLLAVSTTLALLPESTMAKEKFLQGLPNGSSFSKSLGHSGSGYTAFGQMFSGTWSASLCKQKFPGSSITVGQAFGDPCCTWKQGGKPDFTVSASADFPAQSTNTCASGGGNGATAGGATGATGQSSAATSGGGGNGGASAGGNSGGNNGGTSGGTSGGNSGGNMGGNKGDKKSSHKSGKSSGEKSSGKSNKGGNKEQKSSGGGESYSFSSIGKSGGDKGGKEEGDDDRMLRRN